MAPWNDRLQVLEVIGVSDEAPDVKTFTFRSDNQTWFRYKPGQFMTLELPTTDGPLMRTYTLSSSPSRPFSIAVTVKAQAGSIGTRWMFDHLKPGQHVKAYGPAGDFSLHNHPVGQISVHLGRLRRDADDVDAALAERLLAMDRCRLRQLRAAPGRDHFPQGTGTARHPHAGPVARLHDRGAVEPRELVRPYGPHRRDPAADAVAGFPRTRNLLLRAGTVHARRARMLETSGFDMDEIPPGKLRQAAQSCRCRRRFRIEPSDTREAAPQRP